MSRSERLLHLLQVLRRYRAPVSGKVLAEEIGVSIRTLYRDIGSLQVQGANIEGEPGIGYVLRPGYMLPPLMFEPAEIEALVLGTQWVADRGDDNLARAAHNALAKVAAVLPQELRDEIEASTLLVGPGATFHPGAVEPAALRRAIQSQQKLRITYLDGSGERTERTVWPFALAFFDQARVLMCWCELRDGFRNFRMDRISSFDETGQRYSKSRRALLAAWKRTLPGQSA